MYTNNESNANTISRVLSYTAYTATKENTSLLCTVTVSVIQATVSSSYMGGTHVRNNIVAQLLAWVYLLRENGYFRIWRVDRNICSYTTWRHAEKNFARVPTTSRGAPGHPPRSYLHGVQRAPYQWCATPTPWVPPKPPVANRFPGVDEHANQTRK